MSTLKHANKTPATLDIKIKVLISLYLIYLINKDIPIYAHNATQIKKHIIPFSAYILACNANTVGQY